MGALETELAKHLFEAGHNITIVQCGGLINSHCVVMSEAGLSQHSSATEQDRACGNCQRRGTLFSQATDLPTLRLMDFAPSEGFDPLVKNALERVNRRTWQSFSYRNIPVGRYAAYEFILENKVPTLDFPEEIFPFYLNQLSNSMKSLLAWQELLKSHTFEAIVLSNELYSVNRVVRDLARSKGIATHTLGMGTDMRRFGNSITLNRNSEVELMQASTEGYRDLDLRSIQQSDLKQLEEHFLELASGVNAFAYSTRARGTKTPKLFKLLKLSGKRPLVTVITSSLDERLAGKAVDIASREILEPHSPAFASQPQWLAHLVKVAGQMPDIDFVFRIHPRLFPNKRDPVLSPGVQDLRSTLESAPQNVRINWPQDGISIWDLASVTDVALNYTSTAGTEFLFLGVPVIIPDSNVLFSYPASLNIILPHINAFELHIRKAIRDGRDFDRSVNVMKWKLIQFTRTAQNLNNGLPVRGKIGLMRLLNWLFLRKRFDWIAPLLRIVERREMSKTTIDKEFVEVVHEYLSGSYSSLAEVPRTIEPTSSGTSVTTRDLEELHKRVLRKIFGVKRARQLFEMLQPRI